MPRSFNASATSLTVRCCLKRSSPTRASTSYPYEECFMLSISASTDLYATPVCEQSEFLQAYAILHAWMIPFLVTIFFSHAVWILRNFDSQCGHFLNSGLK